MDHIDGVPLRMHYVQEGPRGGRQVVLVPGPPSWSYLYRQTIPVLTDGGCRVVAVDLVGLGRSDKLAEGSAYSILTTSTWLNRLLERVDIRDAIFVAHGLAANLDFSAVGD